MAHGTPRAGHSHTGRALCAAVAERRLCILRTPAAFSSKTATPTSHLPSPGAAPSAGSTTPAAEATFDLAVAQGMPRAGHSHTAGRALYAGVASTFGNSSIQQNRNIPRPSAQLGRSTHCRLCHTLCAQQSLHLTLQWPMACPRLATRTLVGLCALWLSSGASVYGKLQHSAKPQHRQTTT